MKKMIAFAIGIVIGVAVGYASRSSVALMVLMQKEPALNWAFLTDLGESFAFCGDTDFEQRKTYFTLYEQNLTRALSARPDDRESQFYYGIAEAGMASLESQLDHPAESLTHMQNAQKQLEAIGWRDVRPEHIRAVMANMYPESSLTDGQNKASANCSQTTSSKATKD